MQWAIVLRPTKIRLRKVEKLLRRNLFLVKMIHEDKKLSISTIFIKSFIIFRKNMPQSLRNCKMEFY